MKQDINIEMTEAEGEIVERLEALKTIGLETDLDITKIYVQEGEVCCTIFKSVIGIPIGIINRISSKPLYK